VRNEQEDGLFKDGSLWMSVLGGWNIKYSKYNICLSSYCGSVSL